MDGITYFCRLVDSIFLISASRTDLKSASLLSLCGFFVRSGSFFYCIKGLVPLMGIAPPFMMRFFRIHLVLRSVSRRFSLSFILEYANAASIAPMITDAIAITSPIPDEFADAIPSPMIADPVPNNMSPRFI